MSFQGARFNARRNKKSFVSNPFSARPASIHLFEKAEDETFSAPADNLENSPATDLPYLDTY